MQWLHQTESALPQTMPLRKRNTRLGGVASNHTASSTGSRCPKPDGRVSDCNPVPRFRPSTAESRRGRTSYTSRAEAAATDRQPLQSDGQGRRHSGGRTHPGRRPGRASASDEWILADIGRDGGSGLTAVLNAPYSSSSPARGKPNRRPVASPSRCKRQAIA